MHKIDTDPVIYVIFSHIFLMRIWFFHLLVIFIHWEIGCLCGDVYLKLQCCSFGILSGTRVNFQRSPPVHGILGLVPFQYWLFHILFCIYNLLKQHKIWYGRKERCWKFETVCCNYHQILGRFKNSNIF